MASFQAMNRLQMEGKEIKLKVSLRFVPTRRVIKNSKKIQKIKKILLCILFKPK